MGRPALPPPAEPEEPPAFDPLADVMFGGVAMVFLALLLLAPGFARSGADSGPGPAITVAGEQLPVIIASGDGIRPGGPGVAPIGLDAIADDPGLRRFIAGSAHDTGGRLVLLIEPAGGEAAFVLDPMLAAGGIDRLMQVRLTRPCPDHGSSARLDQCFRSAGAGRPP